jgi:hypothetical protein
MTTYEKLKLCLLTFFVVGFLLCFYNYSRNGRYIFKDNDYNTTLDTQTGTIYFPFQREKITCNDFKEHIKVVRRD